MKNIVSVMVGLGLLLSMTSCNKNDYKNDGGMHDAHVNMTTYDYLKSKPQFSLLVRLIDLTGSKDAVNAPNTTFFACTNYSVDEYIKTRYWKRVLELNDENITYTVDSLPLNLMKDSLKMYIFNGDLGRANLTLEGKFYTPVGKAPLNGFYIKLRRTQDYSSYIDHVDYINVTNVRGTRDATEADQQSIPAELKDLSYDCQTTGILTTNGTLHVMNNNHRMFFNTDELPH